MEGGPPATLFFFRPVMRNACPSWLSAETARLRRSWDRHPAGRLRDYLVSDVEDPRLNLSSILSRHFLARLLFGNRYAALMDQEIQFGLAMNWLLGLFREPLAPEDALAILHALRHQRDDAEGREIPGWLLAIQARLPANLGPGVIVPDYLAMALEQVGSSPALKRPPALPDGVVSLFAGLWRKTLARRRPKRFSVLEAACGSANDYRMLAACGLARLVDYTGFDLSRKNIINARKLFPEARFLNGNVLTYPWPRAEADVVLVHDLFEHLSAEALETALAHLCRTARLGFSIGFFNMHEEEDHVIARLEEYHWNRLSLPKIRRQIEASGFETQALHLGVFVQQKFGCPSAPNPHAYMLRAWKKGRH